MIQTYEKEGNIIFHGDTINVFKNYDGIQIEAKTGWKRKLIDYKKSVPTPHNTEKMPGNV